MSGYRGNHRSFKGRGKKNFQDRRFKEGESDWLKSVRENHGAVDIEFADYAGEKLHDLPDSFVALLNADRTEAKDPSFLLEPDIGIDQYVSADIPGFSAILKHRYSDFLVRSLITRSRPLFLKTIFH